MPDKEEVMKATGDVLGSRRFWLVLIVMGFIGALAIMGRIVPESAVGYLFSILAGWGVGSATSGRKKDRLEAAAVEAADVELLSSTEDASVTSVSPGEQITRKVELASEAETPVEIPGHGKREASNRCEKEDRPVSSAEMAGKVSDTGASLKSVLQFIFPILTGALALSLVSCATWKDTSQRTLTSIHVATKGASEVFEPWSAARGEEKVTQCKLVKDTVCKPLQEVQEERKKVNQKIVAIHRGVIAGQTLIALSKEKETQVIVIKVIQLSNELYDILRALEVF